jgi:hypothetical protein
VAAIGYVGWNIYESWKQGSWDVPAANKIEASASAAEKPSVTPPRVALNTDVIVAKNLFDPERGAGATREVEENSRASQRVRNMILVGTVIIGGNRTAILQEGGNPNAGPAAAAQPAATLRLRQGDNVEGYRLSEVADKRVVFTKDATRIELLLDYFRKVEVVQPSRGVPTRPGVPPGIVPPGPRVIPNLPRRGRIPAPGNPTPDS